MCRKPFERLDDYSMVILKHIEFRWMLIYAAARNEYGRALLGLPLFASRVVIQMYHHNMIVFNSIFFTVQ